MSALFDLPPIPEPEPAPKLSADRTRTLKRARLIEQGIHPATRRPLANNGETCRSCVHAVKVHHNSRRYWKCDRVPITGGPGTDIRVSWPACTGWGPS